MPAADLRLALMSFPQRWDGIGTLSLNLLCIPSVDPLTDAVAGAAPAFADHVPILQAIAIPSLDAFPTTTDLLAVRSTPIILVPTTPVPPRPAFERLANQATAQGVTIGPAPPALPTPVARIRKALPASYLAVTGVSPTGDLTTTTDDFGCAIRGQAPGKITGPPKRQTSWGELISYGLRQPTLATALGLRYELTVSLDPAAFANGGWVFIVVAPTDPWAQAAVVPAVQGSIRYYAARLPPLASQPRPVFGAVLFPVNAGGAPTDPSATGEAETYDTGFAQIVHVHQPTANDATVGDGSGIPAPVDAGVQIGWDDEQVVAWTNRQLSLLAARRDKTLDAETPIGVLGYRIDVADITGRAPNAPGPLPWESLMAVHTALPAGFGSFDGELVVEPSPLRLNDATQDAWLPHYFANWRGRSLAVSDDTPNQLLGKAGKPGASTPAPISTLLSYGRAYAFRVRLGDLTGGGPRRIEAPATPGLADVGTLEFQRHVPPKSLRIVPNLPQGAPPAFLEPASLTVFRPVIGYPEVLYTRLGDHSADRDTIVQFYLTQAAGIQPGSGDVAGLPDPDVAAVRIVVEVRAPAHDVAGPAGTLDGTYRVLYSTERLLPALPTGPTPTDPGLTLDLAYVDAPSIVDWATSGWPTNGPLVVPKARDVQLRCEPVLREDPGYFGIGASAALPTTIAMRAEARGESALLVRDEAGDEPIRGFLFRRPPNITAPPVVAQFAQTLRLVNEGLTLQAPPGQRVVFGASKALRHSITADGGTLTFAADSELLRNWVIAIVVDLDRDWTWDGLAGPISVSRNGGIVGSLVVPRAVGPAAVADPANWDRRRSLLVFFDAVDPHEVTGSGFPEALSHAWTLSASIKAETGGVVGVTGTPTFAPGHIPEPPQTELGGTALSLTLPIAIVPKQIPELASAGIALSPYRIGTGYAATEPRQRALWLELKRPIENPAGDALFARVVGHGADPLLYDATPSADRPDEPGLTLDPELMRVIVPHDSDDRAGIGAMTPLEQATDSDRHYLLPLPPGLDPDDPELFGFWTYELRVGHAGDPHAPGQKWWSTAQGRFGRPLRVNGVQHPAPTLYCRAGRVTVPLKLAQEPTPLASLALLTSLHDLLQARPDTEPGARDIGLVTAVRPATIVESFIEATAPYATPLLNGRPLVSPFMQPKTMLCFLLYAQVVQADGSTNRNLLLAHRYGQYFPPQRRDRLLLTDTQRDRVGRIVFSTSEVEQWLFRLGLPRDTALSMLAVELLPGGTGSDVPRPPAAPAIGAAPPAPDPLGADLAPGGRPRRILRVSALVPVAKIC
jgi:hypothetical protein